MLLTLLLNIYGCLLHANVSPLTPLESPSNTSPLKDLPPYINQPPSRVNTLLRLPSLTPPQPLAYNSPLSHVGGIRQISFCIKRRILKVMFPKIILFNWIAMTLWYRTEEASFIVEGRKFPFCWGQKMRQGPILWNFLQLRTNLQTCSKAW